MMSLRSMFTFFFSAFLLIQFVAAQEFLDPIDFKAGLESGAYDLVIDVRSFSEWQAGHIANTGFVENLAISDENVGMVLGCEECTIAIYCQSGNRAGNAIRKLQEQYNFTGTLWNARGVLQWTGAGFELSTDDAILFPCQKSECDGCAASTCTTTMDPPMDDSGMDGDIDEDLAGDMDGDMMDLASSEGPSSGPLDDTIEDDSSTLRNTFFFAFALVGVLGTQLLG